MVTVMVMGNMDNSTEIVPACGNFARPAPLQHKRAPFIHDAHTADECDLSANGCCYAGLADVPNGPLRPINFWNQIDRWWGVPEIDRQDAQIRYEPFAGAFSLQQ